MKISNKSFENIFYFLAFILEKENEDYKNFKEIIPSFEDENQKEKYVNDFINGKLIRLFNRNNGKVVRTINE